MLVTRENVALAMEDVLPDWNVYAVELPNRALAAVFATQTNAATGNPPFAVEDRVVEAINRLEVRSSLNVVLGLLVTPQELGFGETLTPRPDLAGIAERALRL